VILLRSWSTWLSVCARRWQLAQSMIEVVRIVSLSALCAVYGVVCLDSVGAAAEGAVGAVLEAGLSAEAFPLAGSEVRDAVRGLVADAGALFAPVWRW
jgi:hypothetical protein